MEKSKRRVKLEKIRYRNLFKAFEQEYQKTFAEQDEFVYYSYAEGFSKTCWIQLKEIYSEDQAYEKYRKIYDRITLLFLPYITI